MTDRAGNEGFRILDDFVCDATCEPGFSTADAKKQGKNEGVRVIDELIFGGDIPKEADKVNEKELIEPNFRGEAAPSFLHFNEPLKDAAAQKEAWERLKNFCSEESLSRDSFERLCLAIRDRDLADLERCRGLWGITKNRIMRDRVWSAVRSQAITPSRTRELLEAVEIQLRSLVREVETQPDPNIVIETLWPPELIIQDLARQKFFAQMVEIMEALLAEQTI